MNWGQIKKVVAEYLENEEPSFLANLPLFARLAEEDIYRKVQLPMTRDTATTTLTPNDPFLSVPPDSMSIYSLAIVGGEYSFLSPKDEAFLHEVYPNPLQTGKPRFYAYRDEVDLMLAPVPGDFYEVEMHYYKKPVSITGGTGTDPDLHENWLSKNGENAMIFGIVMHGYIYEKGDQDVIQMYAKQFENALSDLKLIVEGRQKKDSHRVPDQRMPV